MRSLLVLASFCLATPAAVAQGPNTSLVLVDPAFTPRNRDTSVATISQGAIRVAAAQRHLVRNALIGGAIGAAAGAVVCTVISNIADDAAVDRFTTCTWKGYLLTGSIGFGVGFLAGWLGSS